MDATNTLTGVINRALALLGEPPIANYDSTATVAKVCRRELPDVLRHVQASFRWPELIEEWAPSEYLDTRARNGWYRFTMPPDVLRILEIYGDWEYQTEEANRVLITLAGSPKVKYLKYSEAVDLWSVQLVDCVKYQLAIAISPTISRSRKETRELMEVYQAVVRPAALRTVSVAATGTTYQRSNHGWNRARRGRAWPTWR